MKSSALRNVVVTSEINMSQSLRYLNLTGSHTTKLAEGSLSVPRVVISGSAATTNVSLYLDSNHSACCRDMISLSYLMTVIK